MPSDCKQPKKQCSKQQWARKPLPTSLSLIVTKVYVTLTQCQTITIVLPAKEVASCGTNGIAGAQV